MPVSFSFQRDNSSPLHLFLTLLIVLVSFFGYGGRLGLEEQDRGASCLVEKKEGGRAFACLFAIIIVAAALWLHRWGS
jgi:hypothetical protein